MIWVYPTRSKAANPPPRSPAARIPAYPQHLYTVTLSKGYRLCRRPLKDTWPRRLWCYLLYLFTVLTFVITALPVYRILYLYTCLGVPGRLGDSNEIGLPIGSPNCSEIEPKLLQSRAQNHSKIDPWIDKNVTSGVLGRWSRPGQLKELTPRLGYCTFGAFLAKMVTQWSHFGPTGGHKVGSKIQVLSKACNF